jgi:SAM-dependent methyltransferase
MKFSFGTNWLSYSSQALDQSKIGTAREAFRCLMQDIDLGGRRFLDIGFGQGIPLFLAQQAGAEVLGIDLDPICARALDATARFFPDEPKPTFRIASILDDEFVAAERAAGGYDIVHSWGVLHHTGDMRRAFRNAASLVKENGILIISIYNRHWTSPFWASIKRLFNRLPHPIQEATVSASYPIFYLRAKALARPNEEASDRGMDLRHDVRDWLGGDPYEYASIPEVQSAIEPLGFELVRCKPTKGFTGCNEFVFRKTRPSS